MFFLYVCIITCVCKIATKKNKKSGRKPGQACIKAKNAKVVSFYLFHNIPITTFQHPNWTNHVLGKKIRVAVLVLLLAPGQSWSSWEVRLQQGESVSLSPLMVDLAEVPATIISHHRNERKFTDMLQGRKENSQPNHGDGNYVSQEECARLLCAAGNF